MKVLVTGGCGFLGSHVCELFREKGWDVVAYDNMTKFELIRTGYNVEAARGYNNDILKDKDVLVLKADICDLATLLERARGCDYIVHTAAQPAMTIALEDPLHDFNNNASGTLNVLEVARRLEIPVAICSTIHIYGTGINAYLKEGADRFELQYYPDSDIWSGEQGIREDSPILTGELTPLHVSKRVGELYASAYIESYNCSVAVFRLTGIYGPRQLGGEDHGWVANFAIRTVLGLPITVFGTDKQVRDILYVTDAAQAFYDWYTHGEHFASGIYNIGGGEACITSISDCLRKLRELTNCPQCIEPEPARKGDLWYFCCDIAEARKTFSWEPKVLPQDGIPRLVDWIQRERRLFK